MAAATIQSLAKKLDKIEALLNLSDWFPEENGEKEVGLSQSKLQELRSDPEHIDGWRYMECKKSVDSKGRTVRRNIQWSKSYINSLFKSPASNAA